MPKIFVGEPFCAVFPKFSGIGEIYGEEVGGGLPGFAVEVFCLTVPKKTVGYPISVSLFLGIDNFYASVG